MLRKLGYGMVVWAVPYVTGIALMGLLQTDAELFKTIMAVEGSVVGAVLAAAYFTTVRANFLREGLVLGSVWIIENWALDFVALVPFANLTPTRYFIEIGFRYIGMLSLTVAIGYALKCRRDTRADAARAA